MTSQIARFINNQLLRGSKTRIGTIKDNPDDPLPRYVVCDAFSDEPLEELKRLLDILSPQEILILAPSLRSARNPIRELANRVALELPEIRIHIPTDDDDRITDKVGANKIIFASYHQAKGIEREAAILFNFSSFEELGLEMVRRPEKYRVWPDTEIELGDNTWEAVADITGTAVPAIFEYQHRGTCTLVNDVLHEVEKRRRRSGLRDKEKETKPLDLLPQRYIDYMSNIKHRLEEQRLKLSDILFTANISNMLQSGYIYKVLSIPFDKYTWFTLEHSDAAFKALGYLISKEARYEIFVGHKFTDAKAGKNEVVVVGRADLFDYSRLWELKWTSAIRPEHVLQVALYGAINKRTAIKKFRELEYIDAQPLMAEKDRSKKKTKTGKKVKIEIDYEDFEDEALQQKLERKSNYLLHIPTKQRIKISSRQIGGKDGLIEVLKKLVKAKIDPPPLAITDKEFLAEAKLGFPSFVGRCTVPPWLSSGWVKQASNTRKIRKIPQPRLGE
ncbi:hypothetical protein ABW20_dc0108775 [Dactylellina cionopaga]|nr:hypothetical protein ABW20_dc0108775 [Dactylellina cionopaga]